MAKKKTSWKKQAEELAEEVKYLRATKVSLPMVALSGMGGFLISENVATRAKSLWPLDLGRQFADELALVGLAIGTYFLGRYLGGNARPPLTVFSIVAVANTGRHIIKGLRS